MNYQFGNYAEPCQGILPTDWTWFPLRRGITNLGDMTLSNPTIAPNPFSSSLKIQVPDGKQAHLTSFVNILGQSFTPQATQTAEGLVLDTEALPAGIYQLSVVVDAKTHLFKVLKQ